MKWMLPISNKRRTTQAVRKVYPTFQRELTAATKISSPIIYPQEISRETKAFTNTASFWLKNLLFIGILLGLVGSFLLWLLNPYTLPITEIQFENHVHTTLENLQAVISIHAIGGFFNVDVQAVQDAVMTLPWVKTAVVRRLWPSTLQVQIQERQAVAWWRTTENTRITLVDSAGNLFTLPNKPNGLANLPIFSGPLDRVANVLAHYDALNPLLAMAGFGIREMGCDTRQSWYMVLDNGILLLLGRSDNENRLRRFFKVYSHIIAKSAMPNFLQQVAHENLVMDLRYTNAIVVRLASETEHAQR